MAVVATSIQSKVLSAVKALVVDALALQGVSASQVILGGEEAPTVGYPLAVVTAGNGGSRTKTPATGHSDKIVAVMVSLWYATPVDLEPDDNHYLDALNFYGTFLDDLDYLVALDIRTNKRPKTRPPIQSVSEDFTPTLSPKSDRHQDGSLIREVWEAAYSLKINAAGYAPERA